LNEIPGVGLLGPKRYPVKAGASDAPYPCRIKLLGRSSVNEMIAAFVRGEFDSKRFGFNYKALLASTKYDRSIIDKPDVTNVDQNRVRHALLQRIRGYPNRVLFQDFPSEGVSWHSIEFDNDEVGELWFANWPTWVELSGGTRRIADGAANVDSVEVAENGISINEGVRAVADRLRSGESFAELIVVAQSLRGPFVTLEGHTRATAYSMVGHDIAPKVRAIAAVAPQMDEWWLFENKTTLR
jgi:hypothetical protein